MNTLPSFVSRRGRCALAALPAAALLLAAAPAHAGAKAVTINFDSYTAAADANYGYIFVAYTYRTQGFTFGSDGSDFAALSGSSPGGDGETSLISENLAGVTMLTQDNGGAFSLNAIDLGPLYGNRFGTLYDGTVTFTGAKADGTTVTDVVTMTKATYQTFTFTDLTDLKSLTFVGSNNGFIGMGSIPEFDNLKLTSSPVPEASSVVSLGLLLGLGGVAVAKRRKAAK